MRDFSIKAFKMLLNELRKNQYEFKTFVEFIETKTQRNKIVILRHDVDKKPFWSQRTVELENKLGIKGTYYFRVNKNKLPKKVIEQVAKMGHEIGYHYDDLHDAGGDMEKALALFQRNLEALRELAPVKTACMHGSPMSRFDNRDMWKERSYQQFGIIGEPYFDIDFNNVMYLTDTGRRWDGERVSIRDKVRGDRSGVMGKEGGNVNKWPKLHSTKDIINAIRNNQLPDQIMLTIHPQRWTDEWGQWMWELVSQKVKNVVKYFLAKKVVSS